MKDKPQSVLKKAAYIRFMPAWKASLFLFGTLIIIVLLYFLWQVRQLQQLSLSHSLEHSKIIASVIERNAQAATLSQKTVEKIILIFLDNTARFIDYLDTVEPFSEQELSEFAIESGLTGIRIIRKNKKYTEGPLSWLKPETVLCLSKKNTLQYLPSEHLFLLSIQKTDGNGYIILGFAATLIEKLHEQSGIPHLLKSLSGLSGIQYIRIESNKENNSTLSPHVFLKKHNSILVAETRMSFGKDMLVLGMDTRHFIARNQQIWNEFVFFGAILAFTGLFFSWLLNRSQTGYLNKIKQVERKLALQREDATIGRTTAAIAHEIRNPLNAISMGLQRLQIEVNDLPDEYLKLVADILKALKRTNNIVTNIGQYAKPLTPEKKKVRPGDIINHITSLYNQKCIDKSISIQCNISKDLVIIADPNMLEQVIENLIKNAIEAQINGGFICIKTEKKDQTAIIAIENSGFDIVLPNTNQILKPYFSTKTRGTGLGLSIVQKIISAHMGQIDIQVPVPGTIKITISLPTGT